MDNLVGEILDLVKLKMKESGAYDRDSFDEYIDETIDYFKQRGKMNDEENEQLIRSELDSLFSHIKSKLADNEIDIIYNEY
ncbi:MAG: hypothetical protein WCG01_00435 [bacterium]